jgi:membrane protein
MRPSSLIRAFRHAVSHFIANDSFTMGAALAYYTVFSMAPLILIAIWIAGAVYGEEAAHGRIAGRLEQDLGPQVAAAIQELIKSARARHGTVASLIGLGLLLFGAAGVFGQLQTSFNTIWAVPTAAGGLWRFVRKRFRSFLMVLGIGMLLLLSLVVSTAVATLNRLLLPDEELAARLTEQGVSFLFMALVFALMYKVLPDCPVAWRDVWVGALLTALLYTAGKYLIGLYLARGTVASAYGAAGSVVVLLVWVFYASQILLFGAQFTQSSSAIRQARHATSG